MKPDSSTQKNVGRLRLEGELAIYRAAEIKSELLAALEQFPVLEINLAEVTELDTAGVQILLLIKRAAEACDRQVRLVAHSDAVAEAFELLNLAPCFGDPLVLTPGNSAGGARSSLND